MASINRFADDSDADLERIRRECADAGLAACITDFRESGGAGGTELAEAVVELCERPSQFRCLYDLDLSIPEKVETIARAIYGAGKVTFTPEARAEIKRIADLGYGGLPVCMAKTPASLTDDPKLAGRPAGFEMTVSSAKVSAGAGFVVIYTGKIMTMPGLPKLPAALSIDVDDAGNIVGLF